MRKIYLLVNLILLAVVVGLIAAHHSFKPTPADKILRWEPEKISEKEATNQIQIKTPQLSVIRSKNVFSPTRGDELSTLENEQRKATPPPRFELIGICSIGDDAGAIIDLKNATGNDRSNKVRRYYALGTEVYGGFFLDSVAEKSVILKRHNEVLELKIDRSRYAEEVGKKKALSPVPPGRPPEQQPPRNPSSPVGPAINPTNKGPGMPPPGVNPKN